MAESLYNDPKPFDSRWGISPACYVGDHVGLDDLVVGECMGEWNVEWERDDPMDSLMLETKDWGWAICTCACHGFITDLQWSRVREALKKLET